MVYQTDLNHAEQYDSQDKVTTLKQLMHANSKQNQQIINTQHSHTHTITELSYHSLFVDYTVIIVIL